MNLTHVALLIFCSAAVGLLLGRYPFASGRHMMFGHGYTERHRLLGECGMKTGDALDAAWQDGIADLVRGRRDAVELAARVREHDTKRAAGRGDTRPVMPDEVAARPSAIAVSPQVVPGPAERDVASGASGHLPAGRPPAGPGTTYDLDHPAPAGFYPELAALADVPPPGIEAAQPNASAAAVDHAGRGHATQPDELAEELAFEAETYLRALRESADEWHQRLEDEHREWCVSNGLEWQPFDRLPGPLAELESA